MSGLSKLMIAALFVLGFAATANAQGMSYSYGGFPPGSRLDPQVNVYLSRIYDWRLQTDWRFRAYRTRRECRPITIPALRQDCVASFDQYEPFIGWRGRYWY
jgi:hypothetical protein